ncbi:MAG: MFS transporter [Candidatus Hodarchaeales archaeon]
MRKFNLLNLNIMTLILTHFLWGFVNIIYMIQIQPYLLSIYGTSSEAIQILGLILSIGSLSAVIPLAFGFLGDRFGRKRLMNFGLILSFLGLFGLTIDYSGIILTIVSIAVFNTGIGFYDPPLNGLIYESSSSERRGLVYSLVYNSSSIAGIIGSLLIQLTGNQGLIGLFQLSCLLLGVATIINVLAIRDFLPNRKTITFGRILTNRLSRLTIIAFVLDSISWGLPLSIANGVYILLFEVDVNFIASLTFIETILLVLLQFPAGFFVDRFGRIAGLIAGQTAGIIWLLLVIGALNSIEHALDLLYFAYAALGISIAFWRPSMTLSFVEVDSTAPSTNFGFLAFFQRLGLVPTAAIGGYIFSLVGFIPLLIFTFLGTLIVIVIFLKISKIITNPS